MTIYELAMLVDLSDNFKPVVDSEVASSLVETGYAERIPGLNLFRRSEAGIEYLKGEVFL